MAEFDFKLVFSLKRAAIIRIAEIFWKSPDITIKINELITQNLLQPRIRRYRYASHGRMWASSLSDNFRVWEKLIIPCVLKKVSSLCLSTEAKKHLRKAIVFMGEKIFYFYDEFSETHGDDMSRLDYARCHKCIAAAGKNFFSFSPVGTMMFMCSSLHLRHVSLNDPENRQEFLQEALDLCNEELVNKFRNEILVLLQSLQPGLTFRHVKDIEFNIICVWHFMKSRSLRRGRPNESGYYQIPQNYLINNKDFIIPLQVVAEMCKYLHPPGVKYFSSKLYSLDKLNFYKIAKIVVVSIRTIKINDRLHHYPAPDRDPDKVLYILNLMSTDEKSDFVRDNLIDLVTNFLPVCPFQEKVPAILDLCLQRNFDIQNKLLQLLDLIVFCIESQNKRKYKFQKSLHLKIFEKVFFLTPKKIKLGLFVAKTKSLIFQNPNFEVLKLILKDKDLKKEGRKLTFLLVRKWGKLLKKKNFEVVKEFVSGLPLLCSSKLGENNYHSFDRFLRRNFYRLGKENQF